MILKFWMVSFSRYFFWKVFRKVFLRKYIKKKIWKFFGNAFQIFFHLKKSVGNFNRNVFSGKFFPKCFFRNFFPESFSRKFFFRKVFSGKFFLESFWTKNSERFFFTIWSDFLIIFRQYKTLDFFLDFFKFRFRKQIWTFTFPEFFSFAISNPYLEQYW